MKILKVGAAVVLLAALAACNPRQPDGGNATGQPYDQPGRHLPNDRSFFPVGTWLARVNTSAEAQQDKALGLNTYFALDHNAPASDLDVIEAEGMHVVANVNDWHGTDHPAIDGWLVVDEPDLNYRSGSDPWSGVEGWNTCIPIQDEGGRCGFTVLDHFNSLVPDGDMRWTNFTFELLDFTDQAGQDQFVNGGYQDVLSADIYYFSHAFTTPEDRKASNYGQVVKRMRDLDALSGGTAPADRQPVWGMVEVGNPWTDPGARTIAPAEVNAAVWHEIIAGARGIVYFNHNFGGPCPSFNVLRMTEAQCPGASAMSSTVTAINARLAQLATLLNGEFIDDYITSSANISVAAKLGGNDAAFGAGAYVFAGANWSEYSDPGTQQATITVLPNEQPQNGTATVLYENRTVPIVNGQIIDTFESGNAIHIYKLG